MSIRKYSLDEVFFDQWSPVMAYILGFWFADGYIRHEKSYRTIFCSQDYDLLLQIRDCMGSTNQICRTYSKKSKGQDYQLVVYSKHIYLRIKELGGRQCKSRNRNIHFPKISERYYSDFVRGFFDGDGSIFYVNYISTKNGKPRTELRSNFTSGNPLFLERFQKILIDKIGVSSKKICPFNEGASWKLGYATGDTIKLLKFMYYPGYTIALARKASFAEDILTGRNLICRGIGTKFARVLEW